MPVTPFHFGPGLLFMAIGGPRFSWLAFAFANVLIDLEPIGFYLATGNPIHPYAHTYPGALVVGIVAAWVARPPGEAWLRFWNRQLSPAQRRWLGAAEGIPATAAWTGALIGTLSHVALDSVMHYDVRPWWPLAEGNALLRVVSLETLHWSCVAAGIAGGLWLLSRRIRSRQKQPPLSG